MAKAFWVQFYPIDTANSKLVAVSVTSLNSEAGTRVTGDANVFLPYLESYPKTSISVFDGEFSGHSEVTIDSIELTAQFLIDGGFLSYNWDGALARVYKFRAEDAYPGMGLAGMTPVFEGVVKGSPEVSDGLASISLIDKSYLLEVNTLTLTYAGTGGIEGAAGLQGTFKPLALGLPLAVDPIMVDPAFLCYQYHGYGKSGGVQRLSENGILFNAPKTVVAWQGTIAATYVSLKNLTLGLGEWADAPSIGMFRLGGEPASGGVLVADVAGALDANGALVTRAIDVVQFLVFNTGVGSNVNAQSLTTFQTAIGDLSVADYLTSQAQIDELVASYCKGAGGYYFFDTSGRLSMGLVRLSTGTDFTFRTDGTTYPLPEDIKAVGVSSPYKSVRIGAQQCFRVHTIEEVSSALKDAVIAAGGKLDTIEVGATRGATVGDGFAIASNVAKPTGGFYTKLELETALGTSAAIVGQGAFATKDSVPYGSTLLTGFGTLAPKNNLYFGDPLFLEGAGGITATINAFKTALGISSGFFGQGALATLSSLANGSSFLTGFGGLSSLTDVIIGAARGGAYGLLTQNGFATSDNSLITSLGTAAAFLGQGILSTKDVVRLGAASGPFGALVSANNSFYVTDEHAITSLGVSAAFSGQGGLATRNFVKLGFESGILNESQTSWVTDSTAITSLGTSAAFSGQGAMATLSFASLGSRVTDSFGTVLSNGQVITGQGTAAAIFGQGFGATAARNLVDNTYVPVGVNTQIDSGFVRTFVTWFAVGASSGGYQLEFNRPDYSGKRSVAYLWHPGTPAAGEICDAVGLGKWTGFSLDNMMKYCLPVKVGDVIAARIQAAPHRCIAQLYLLVFNKDGGLILAPSSSGGVDGGGYLGDNFGEIQVSATITDPNAAYAQLMVRLATDGRPNPYLFFSEPWLGKLANANSSIPPYSPGPNDPTSDRTGANTSAGFTGQGLLATTNLIRFGGPVPGYGGLVGENGSYYVSDVMAITSQGTSAAFAGQGAFATQSYISLSNTSFFAADGRFSASPQHGSSYFAASAVAFAAGETTETLRPEERGGNRTETRTAAAFNSQGTLATQDVVRLGSPSGRLGGLVSQDNTYYVSDAHAITSQGTSAAFIGQAFLATQNSVTLNTTTIRRADGSTVVSETLVVTEVGVAAAFYGQGGLSTKNNVGTGEIADNAVSNFTSSGVSILQIEAGNAERVATGATLTTSGGRLRVELICDTVRNGAGTNVGQLTLMLQMPNGQIVGLGRTVKCLAVADGPPLYYVAYASPPAGTYTVVVELSVGIGKGSNTWSVVSGTVGIEETKR